MFSTILIAQLQLDIQLKENLENDGNISKKNTIILTFTNNSDNDMVFPLNTEGIRPLFDGEDCIQKQKEFEINNAMPIINLKLNGKPVEFGRGLHHIDTNIPYDKPKTQNFYSSLIFIKAQQKLKYQLYFNPHEFYDNANEVFYWYYQTQKNSEKLFLTTNYIKESYIVTKLITMKILIMQMILLLSNFSYKW